MDRRVPVPVVDKRFAQDLSEQEDEMSIDLSHQNEFFAEDTASDHGLIQETDVLNQVSQLESSVKVALIHRLLADLESDGIQAVLEFGQRELAERQRRTESSPPSIDRHTRLLLKKDYTYQDRGLKEPTQYYVYLRRRKPKLDRYIGTLFYVPQGCTLSYFPDAEGRILFNPPNNVFQLKDFKDPSIVQVVRLVCLVPPPPDYTFTKQQNDTPEIYLHLEYLDPTTYQPIAEEVYPFPMCMYEGGTLDRYRWDVSVVQLPSDVSTSHVASHQHVNGQSSKGAVSESGSSTARPSHRDSVADSSHTAAQSASTKSSRRVIKVPATASVFFMNHDDASLVLERMRLWSSWSEKAMPQSKWEVVQDEAGYTLMNAGFKRKILSFSSDRASITLENSLPVLMKWFHDLSLAVSQSSNQGQYSAEQLKLVHKLFVDMSRPQSDPLIVLKALFGVEFSKTPLP